MNWFAVFVERLRDSPKSDVWSDGAELILCKTESVATAIADLIEQLYAYQNEEVTMITGYYDPEEDKRDGIEDIYTGWWYITID